MGIAPGSGATGGPGRSASASEHCNPQGGNGRDHEGNGPGVQRPPSSAAGSPMSEVHPQPRGNVRAHAAQREPRDHPSLKPPQRAVAQWYSVLSAALRPMQQ